MANRTIGADLFSNIIDIVNIAKVQKYYTNRISSISNLSYKQPLRCLKLDSLKLGRLYFDLRMVYKIIHGLNDVTFDDLFTFSPNRSTRGHVYKLYCSKIQSKCSKSLFLTTLYHSMELFIKSCCYISVFKYL